MRAKHSIKYMNLHGGNGQEKNSDDRVQEFSEIQKSGISEKIQKSGIWVKHYPDDNTDNHLDKSPHEHKAQNLAPVPLNQPNGSKDAAPRPFSLHHNGDVREIRQDRDEPDPENHDKDPKEVV